MKVLYKIKEFFREMKWYHDNDPVKKCNLYIDHGCAHVDGMLCDYPNCAMEAKYVYTGLVGGV